MVDKVNESYNPGQFLTGNLNHFSVTFADFDASTGDVAFYAARKHLVETTTTRGTVVLLGELVDGTAEGTIRIAVENNGAWTATTLAAALNVGTSGWVVADFVY